jgi:hypothetical protein
MPRRRGGARALAVEVEAEHGVVMRMLLRNPKDMVAGLLAAAVVCAIIVNALFLQAGRHPSPMFGTVVALPASVPAVASPLPRPRPPEVVPSEPKAAEARSADPKTSDPKTSDPKTSDPKTSDPKTSDPMTSLLSRSNSAAPPAPANVARPPAPIPWRGETTQSTGWRRTAAVQRALTEYGYGQLKPTGTIGPDTQAAIQRFERDRKLPVTGQISDRVVRELSAMIGHPID